MKSVSFYPERFQRYGVLKMYNFLGHPVYTVEYKRLSLNDSVITTNQPSYMHNLISVQSPRSTRCSSLLTLARPSTSSSLRITDRSFQYAFPRLWNQLPASLRQPRTNLSNSDSSSSLTVTSSVPSTHHFHHPSPPRSFTPGLKPSFSANPSHRSLPFLLPDWLHGFPGLSTDTSEHIRFFVFSFSVLHFLVTYLLCSLPLVPWHCWLGDRKGIRHVKNRHGIGSHFVTQQPSDPGIWRPRDPVDPVILFYNELRMLTYA